MSPWYEQAKKYYPALWSRARLEKLVELGRLTQAEYEEVVSELDTGEGG